MEMFKTMSTTQLISLFIDCGKRTEKEMPTLRGWLMDELESRNAEAFENWLDLENPQDEDLYTFYAA